MILKNCPNCKVNLMSYFSKMMKGKSNPNWKGNNVKYSGIHMWVLNNYGKPKKCEKCGLSKKRKDGRNGIRWANISGKYTRERKDWTALCALCHTKERKDHGINKYKNRRKNKDL